MDWPSECHHTRHHLLAQTPLRRGLACSAPSLAAGLPGSSDCHLLRGMGHGLGGPLPMHPHQGSCRWPGTEPRLFPLRKGDALGTAGPLRALSRICSGLSFRAQLILQTERSRKVTVSRSLSRAGCWAPGLSTWVSPTALGPAIGSPLLPAALSSAELFQWVKQPSDPFPAWSANPLSQVQTPLLGALPPPRAGWPLALTGAEHSVTRPCSDRTVCMAQS